MVDGYQPLVALQLMCGLTIRELPRGLTPLHLAAIHGRLDGLKLLIEKHKFDVNLPSTTGWRPLHLAISNQTGKRALQCLTYLLEKGGDPSITNDDDITPCHQAASEGHVQCLKLLIEVKAMVDGKDCRGHTPLDLAKLWGHRKCARILSAEIWHKEKDHVAKEMNQLKRLKMQHVLKEIEQEEQFLAAQKFYGNLAFKEWLEKHDLDDMPTGPLDRKPSEVSSSSVERAIKPGTESLYKANSVTPKTTVKAPAQKTKKGREEVPIFREPSKLSSLPEEEGLEEANAENQAKEEASTGKKNVPSNVVYTNPNEWVKSTKVPVCDYTVNLSDDYPRDTYTMMPMTEDAPKFYDGSFWRKIETPEHEVERLREKKLRKPDLPKEMVQRVLSQDHTRQQRPFIFKPVHIHDVNAKRKHPKGKNPRSEASLHICNDTSSILFQESLQEAAMLRHGSGCSTTSHSSSQSSRTRGNTAKEADFSRVKVLTALESMTKPTRFPPIHGEEYELHLVK